MGGGVWIRLNQSGEDRCEIVIYVCLGGGNALTLTDKEGQINKARRRKSSQISSLETRPGRFMCVCWGGGGKGGGEAGRERACSTRATHWKRVACGAHKNKNKPGTPRQACRDYRNGPPHLVQHVYCDDAPVTCTA